MIQLTKIRCFADNNSLKIEGTTFGKFSYIGTLSESNKHDWKEVVGGLFVFENPAASAQTFGLQQACIIAFANTLFDPDGHVIFDTTKVKEFELICNNLLSDFFKKSNNRC